MPEKLTPTEADTELTKSTRRKRGKNIEGDFPYEERDEADDVETPRRQEIEEIENFFYERRNQTDDRGTTETDEMDDAKTDFAFDGGDEVDDVETVEIEREETRQAKSKTISLMKEEKRSIVPK